MPAPFPSARRARRLLGALGVLLALVVVPDAKAAAGEPDPGFGTGGIVKLFHSKSEISFAAIASQADGGIVIVGGEDPGKAVVARVLENGALDPGFGQGGRTTVSVPGGLANFMAVAVQPDGKIVAAGTATVGASLDFLVARYDSHGAPDPGFGGGDGIETVPVSADADEAEAVAIGRDGRIVATGLTATNANPKIERIAVAVLQADGRPDPAFAGDGSQIVDPPADRDEGRAVAALSDGRILIADASGSGGGNGFTLLRLTEGGQPDLSFGGDGIVETPIPGEGLAMGAGKVRDLVVQGDGRILASGQGLDLTGSPPTGDPKFAAARYLPDGALDQGFGSGGIFTKQLGPGEEGAAAVQVAATGKVLLAGFHNEEGVVAPAVMRLGADGMLDPAFGSGGVVLRRRSAEFAEDVADATLDTRGRLLTVGLSGEGNDETSVVVSRYLGDPPPPPPPNRPAHARIKAVPRSVKARKLKGFAGTAADPDGDRVQRVQIAVVKSIPQATASARGAGRRCLALVSAKPRFKRLKPKAGKCPRRWLAAKGQAKWSFRLQGALPPGGYVVYARATDSTGLTETAFSRKLRNRYGFRVLPSR